MTTPLDTRVTFDAVLTRTRRAAPAFAATSREQRERVLSAMGAELDAHRDELIELAREETHYSAEILAGELTRTTDQLRFFGEVLADGSYLERATDADQGSIDVHRMLVPLGIVGIFGSSNFPFAYGVAGGDSASALASGCAVIVKEHPSHPRTCQAVLAHLKTALVSTGFDPETVNMVSGFEAGVALVTAPDIKAIGFTGSTNGGRALYDLAVSRPSPIPFYGELGSLNPVVVSPAAAHERAANLGVLLAGSMLQRAGQMCTKPGVIVISEGPDGDEVVRAMAERVDAESSVPLLNPVVRHQYIVGTQSMSSLPGVTLRGGALSEGGEESDPVRPALFEATTSEFSGAESLSEIFGPTSIVLRYRDSDDARALLASLDPALVGGVHAADEDPHAADLMQAMLPGVGRIVWNGATTGLAVGWATHHGGSYPASTSLHSSVGASAIRRWLRPVAYQGVPDQFLPAELAPAGAVR